MDTSGITYNVNVGNEEKIQIEELFENIYSGAIPAAQYQSGYSVQIESENLYNYIRKFLSRTQNQQKNRMRIFFLNKSNKNLRLKKKITKLFI